MKKLLSTLTALAFAMSLTAAGYAQTAGKEVEKPAVKTESQAAPAQVTTKEAGKVSDPAQTGAPTQKQEKKGKETAGKPKEKGQEKGQKDVKPATPVKKEGEQSKK